MDFIEHTIAWCKGEIFEAKIIAFSGLILLGISLLLWKIGETPNAKALQIPTLLMGLLFLLFGSIMFFSNNKRIKDFSASYKENPIQFVESEKQRAEAFIKWYPITIYAMAVLIIAGLVSYIFWGGITGRTLGLSLILFALSGLLIDHFSEERAETYYAHITQELHAS